MQRIASIEDWKTWRAAALEPAVAGRIEGMLAGLAADVAARGPTCWSSGKCCNFNAYGHRLYVTGLEAAWTLAGIAGDEKLRGLLEVPVDLAGACLFQVEGLCGVHKVRPMGCRVYFCQKGTQEWQNDLYEKYQGEVRRIHDEYGLPYLYAEWRALVKEGIQEVG
jgi:Fe-S-cluster containining protein